MTLRMTLLYVLPVDFGPEQPFPGFLDAKGMDGQTRKY